MRYRSSLAVILPFLVGCASTAPTGGPVPSPEDRQAVIDVVEGFFDAFNTQDLEGMQSQWVPGGRLVVTAFDDLGNPTTRVIDNDQFLPQIANRQGPPIAETIWNPQVTVHDNLASIWVDYNLWVGDTIDHCGKDNFQLARTTEGWKIIAVADTQRPTGCQPVVRQVP